jgi:hypothetical protein
MHDYRAAEMDLLCGVVMVYVDFAGKPAGRGLPDDFLAAILHGASIRMRKEQGEIHGLLVFDGLLGIHGQICQIAVRELYASFFAIRKRYFMEMPCNFITEVAASAMDHKPEPPVAARLDLAEMVAAAKRPQLPSGVFKFGSEYRNIGDVLEALPGLVALMMIESQRYGLAYGRACGADSLAIDVLGYKIRLYRAHAAADIHSHGIGDNGVQARNYAADRHAEPFVTIRHKRDMSEHKR